MVSLSEEDVSSGVQKLKPVSTFRTLLPQVIASLVKNLIMFETTVTMGFPTIIIATLLKSKDDLHLTTEQASWLGCFVFVSQPIGSIISALFIEPHGRKRSMLLINIPHVIGWLMLYMAQSRCELYIAVFILGLGTCISPAITYDGEICQPQWRGLLSSATGFFITFAYTFSVLLGLLTDWQTAAGICLSIPVITFCVILLLPESPVWLITQGKMAEAEKSLCWLRGWVKPEYVQAELQELTQHNFRRREESLKRLHTPGWRQALADLHLEELKRRQTLQPLVILITISFFVHNFGVTGPRPFLVGIFEGFDPSFDGHLFAVIWSAVGFIGNILCVAGVKKLGMKKIAIISLVCGCLSNWALSIHEFVAPNSEKGWIPSMLFIFVAFSTSLGFVQLPWMLMSEIFPIRGRNIGSAIATTFACTNAFIGSKAYTYLINLLTFPGVFAYYGFACSIGCIFIYFLLPDTKGKTLQEIDELFEHQYQTLKTKLFKKS